MKKVIILSLIMGVNTSSSYPYYVSCDSSTPQKIDRKATTGDIWSNDRYFYTVVSFRLIVGGKTVVKSATSVPCPDGKICYKKGGRSVATYETDDFGKKIAGAYGMHVWKNPYHNNKDEVRQSMSFNCSFFDPAHRWDEEL